MKIKMSQLRSLIREAVEEAMGGWEYGTATIKGASQPVRRRPGGEWMGKFGPVSPAAKVTPAEPGADFSSYFETDRDFGPGHDPYPSM